MIIIVLITGLFSRLKVEQIASYMPASMTKNTKKANCKARRFKIRMCIKISIFLTEADNGRQSKFKGLTLMSKITK